jgi:excisionase family DNA binding protein
MALTDSVARAFEKIGSAPLWKVEDVARYLNMSVSWVYKAVERGELPVQRICAAVRFRPDDVRRYVDKRA